MSARTAVAEAPDRVDVRSLPGETGMVERKRRLLPFDPWHLFLAPLAAIMLLPMVWMVVTSLETPAQTLRFPPTLWPGTLRFGNYATTIRQSAFGTWFWIDPTNDVIFVGIIQRWALGAPIGPNIEELTRQLTYQALVDPKK